MKRERVYEYRINKKACECFRCGNLEYTLDRLQQLQEKHPNTKYTLQERSCEVDKYGLLNRVTISGEICWSFWHDRRVSDEI